MSLIKPSLKFAAVFFALALFTGCESTDGGGSVHTSVYYGVGFYDPWYYGDYDEDIDVDINRPDRPGGPNRPDWGARPEHPIARPPAASQRPAARPMPSIPSTPRPAMRGGGGGGRR